MPYIRNVVVYENNEGIPLYFTVNGVRSSNFDAGSDDDDLSAYIEASNAYKDNSLFLGQYTYFSIWRRHHKTHPNLYTYECCCDSKNAFGYYYYPRKTLSIVRN
jgi:hypothetical protein